MFKYCFRCFLQESKTKTSYNLNISRCHIIYLLVECSIYGIALYCNCHLNTRSVCQILILFGNSNTYFHFQLVLPLYPHTRHSTNLRQKINTVLHSLSDTIQLYRDLHSYILSAEFHFPLRVHHKDISDPCFDILGKTIQRRV